MTVQVCIISIISNHPPLYGKYSVKVCSTGQTTTVITSPNLGTGDCSNPSHPNCFDIAVPPSGSGSSSSSSSSSSVLIDENETYFAVDLSDEAKEAYFNDQSQGE